MSNSGKFPRSEEEIDKIIGYSPRPLQKIITDKERRFNSQVVHRRFGKTVMKARKLVVRAVFCPHSKGRYAYFAQTYSSAEDIAWMYIREYQSKLLKYFGLDPDDPKYTKKNKLIAYIPNFHGGFSRIRLYE